MPNYLINWCGNLKTVSPAIFDFYIVLVALYKKDASYLADNAVRATQAEYSQRRLIQTPIIQTCSIIWTALQHRY